MRINRVIAIGAVAVLSVLSMSSCGNGGGKSWNLPGDEKKAHLPTASGKAGEIVVIMKKAYADGELGTLVRKTLGGETPYLLPVEPLFKVSLVPPTVKSDVFHQQRNLVIFDIEPGNEPSEYFRSDVWAKPQALVLIKRKTQSEAMEAFDSLQVKMKAFFEKAERERIVSNARRYEVRSIYDQVAKVLGGSPHFPSGYSVRKVSDDFVWVDDTKQYTRQGVLMYRYPVGGEVDPFNPDNMLRHRNEFLKENVPGMFEGSFMTTSTYIDPTVEYINDAGRRFAQMRGYWDVENDFMGGPFVDHFFYSEDGKYIVVLDAFVYAPKFDKRQYLRQVESLLYSFEWKKK